MPSLKMKMKSSTDSPRENNGLHVCQKSSKISKNSFSHARNFQHEAELDTFTTNKHDDSFCNKATCQETRSDETSCCEMVDEEILQLQKHISPSSNLGPVCRMDHTQANCPSTIETIFSPILDSIDIDIEPNCNVSDFFFSDTISISEATCLLDYEYDESSRFSVEEYMLLPFLEDSIETTSQYEDNIINSESIILSEESNIYLAIHQESDINDFPDWDPTEFLDPQIFIRNFLDLSEMSTLLPQESRERKSVTLVLDLDETLVHSSLEQCDDADFTFPVVSSFKEHTVYVKQRPYLRAFLEKVSEMFDIVVFTASQSIYAKQLLDILDQDGKIISRRAYRESCIFTDGSYTKDLTVLGVDLAKIVIIDNSPQVFRLQVNNGIPIKSWFDDPSDCALITLLPFLETLVDAEDVRPIIAKRFGNKE